MHKASVEIVGKSLEKEDKWKSIMSFLLVLILVLTGIYILSLAYSLAFLNEIFKHLKDLL